MKKILILSTLILYGSILSAQNRLDTKIDQAKKVGMHFNSADGLMTPVSYSRPNSAFKDAQNFTSFNYNRSALGKSANAVTLNFETKELGMLTVNMLNVSDEILSPKMKQVLVTDREDAMAKAMHFRGTIEGMTNSLVAISFFEKEMMGVISVPKYGDFNIAKTTSGIHTVVLEDNVKTSPFVCDVTDEMEAQIENATQNDSQFAVSTGDLPCTEIFFETDYDIYNHFNQSTQQVDNFISGLFNQVATIYEMEGITVLYSDRFIWQTPDPYTSTDTDINLTTFKNTRTSFNGDLAHLLTFRSADSSPVAVGIAYRPGLCGNSPYGLSSLFPEFENFPIYSRQVKVVTHELGHNFSSHHTHACAWNGNNTTIDDYGNFFPSGSPIDRSDGLNGGCISATNYIPKLSVTPTIMSYFDTARHGNFPLSNGFGIQPGDRIRSYLQNANCVDVCGVEVEECQTINEVTVDLVGGENRIEQAQIQVKASNTVVSASSANYHGGEEVLLIGDFTVESGGELYAHIEDCDSNGTNAFTVNNTPVSDTNEPLADLLPRDVPVLIVTPNPVRNQLEVISSKKITRIEIYNPDGVIMDTDINGNFIDVSSYPNGLYLVRVVSEDGVVETVKFVKM